MRKILYLIGFLLVHQSGFSQTKSHGIRYSFVFIYDSDSEVDLLRKTVKHNGIKNLDKLRLSPDEENLIWDSFRRNAISKLKGEVMCINDSIVVAPSTNFQVKIFRNYKLVSTIFVDSYFESKGRQINSSVYRGANFVGDIKIMLENNAYFKKSFDKLIEYRERNRLIRL